jgi:hypothetical protein
MKLKSRLALCGFLLAATSLAAQSVVQTVNFNHTASYTLSDTASVNLVGTTFFTGIFDPFDSSLGTLDSMVIAWDLANTADGTLGSSGGYLSLSVVGNLTLNGAVYQGGVTGNDAYGGAPNKAFSLSAPVTATDTFLATDEDHANYDVATGDSVFTVGYGAPVKFSSSFGLESFEALTSGSVTVTYNYTATAVPEPATCAVILSLLALAGAVGLKRRRRC